MTELELEMSEIRMYKYKKQENGAPGDTVVCPLEAFAFATYRYLILRVP